MTGTKKPKIKRVYQGPIAGQGETVTDAKADLKANVTAALEGNYNPAIISHDGYQAVVYRTPMGWEYKLFDADRPMVKDGIVDVSGTCMMGNVTRNEAIQSAAAHLVGLDSVDYHTHDEFPEFLTDPHKRSNIITTRRFNRAYQWAKANKPEGRDNDHLWHEWAGWNMHDEQFA